MRTVSLDEAFLDLVTADDDLVRAEFDALIAASWDAPPPPPPAVPAPADRPPGWPAPRGPEPVRRAGRLVPARRPTRQRSPPQRQVMPNR
jgi:hypothetical protein